MYIPCKAIMGDNVGVIAVKQQWLIMQKSNRNEHPHKAAINNVIKEIKKIQQEEHEIISSIDGNEDFTQAKGEIAKMCRAFNLYDPLCESS